MPVSPRQAAPRIASLVPSVTELVIALGLGPCLVARTGFCIHPAEALRDVPKVGGTKDVNLTKLRALAPTHVIVNVDENRRETAEAVASWGAQLIVTHPRSPEDNLALFAQLAEAFGDRPGVVAAADALADELRHELEATVTGPPTPVLYLIWKDPWMTVARDTYVSRMLAQVGWRTVPERTGGDAGAARYPALQGTESWLAGVEQVLLSSEPYRFDERHVDAARALCPGARVRLVDGELLSWYGPRAAAGLRYLRRLAEDVR